VWRFLRPPRLATARFIVTAFLLWRGALFAVDFAVVHTVAERQPNPDKDYSAFPRSPFWDSFARWDSGWYDRIARRGYYHEGNQSNVAFFPAYPYLSRWLGRVVGGRWVAGLLISNLALLLGLFFLHGIARRYLDEDGARRTVLFALVFPGSWFFSAFYTEGLFFLSVAGAFYFYERDRLLPAGLFGCLAALTRSTGLLLLPALLLGALHRRGWRLRDLTPRLLYLLLIPAGLGVFMWVLAHQVGDPWAWASGQAGWGRGTSFPLLTLFEEAKKVDWSFPWSTYSTPLFLVLDLVTTLGLFAVVAASLRRLDSAHAIFALLCILVPLASGRALSMLRFAACIPPLFLVLAMAAKRPLVDRFLTYAFALFLALETVYFSRWYWAG
jgi:Gpi18-like mannosyltransferase